MMNWRVALSDIDLGTSEMEAVMDVLSSRWLSMGAITQAFEQEFASAHGVPEAIAVSSGTAALHIAALLMELGPDDEVIVPSLSFVASAAVVALSGARPVFADVKGSDDLTIDPHDVARLITSRTRAIVVMHYGGYAADMAALLALARQHDVLIIEDAAHAPLVCSKAGMLGTVGDIGCFSFFATKNMTTGEGGMLVLRDPELRRKARLLRSHCMTTTSWDKHKGRSSSYDVIGAGLNYRPTDIAAAMGRVQLTKLPQARQRRQELVRQYRSLLSEEPDIGLPFHQREHESAHHLFPILLPPGVVREDFQHRLAEEGIQSSVHYPPTHLFEYYRHHNGSSYRSLPVTEDIAAREVSLPLHACLTEEQVDWIARTVLRRLKR